MRRERVLAASPGAVSIGWISTTDAIFLGLVFALGAGVVVYAKLQSTEQVRQELESDLLACVQQWLDEVDRLREESTASKAAAMGERQKIEDQNQSLQEKLKRALDDLKKTREELLTRVHSLEKEKQRLEQDLKSAETKLEVARRELQDARLALAEAQNGRKKAEDKLKEAQDLLAKSLLTEKAIRKELVGLVGPLKRVAILVDSSDSMTKSSGRKGAEGTDASRWAAVRGTIETWLQHLQFDECVLIVFSADAKAFPASGSLLTVSDPDEVVRRAKREQLLAYLKSVNPGYWTNTLAAMQTAYRYENVDTIILFSDGAPSFEDKGDFNSKMAAEIYDLCRQHPGVPVNCIGLGDYFDKDLSEFLHKIAEVTGGTFLGR